MDTVFLIIKDGNKQYYGADHFGYDDKIIKEVSKILETKTIDFPLYPIDGKQIEDIEALIDFDKESLILDLNDRSLKGEKSFQEFKKTINKKSI